MTENEASLSGLRHVQRTECGGKKLFATVKGQI